MGLRVEEAQRVRERRRLALRRERQGQRWHQRLRRGQTLIIFALSLTMLMAVAGLTIDATRLYDTYARMQRAAEAGALAGVLYLPNYYGTPLPSPGDGNTAISRASIEVVKNGFGSVIATSVTSDCPTPITSAVIAVCQISTGTGSPYQLRVTVTQTVSVVLLGGLGIGPTTLSASGQAAYLPPVALGVSTTAASYFGDEGECNATGGTQTNCNPTGSGAHTQNFMANISGPGELKERGDPYVYCEEGPSQGPPSGSADQSLAITPLPYTTYNGLGTNHAQYTDAGTLATITTNHCGAPGTGGSPAGNPDQQPPGYDGPMTAGTSHPGAYNYGINIPAADAGASLWVYNGNFVPYIASSNNCHGKQSVDTFFKTLSCSNWYPNYGTLTFNGKFDDPSFYYYTTFTLYSVTSLYFRNLDQPVKCTGCVAPLTAGQNVQRTFHPYDEMTADLQFHGCTSSQAYDLSDFSSYSGGGITPTKGCVSTPQCQLSWCNIAQGLPAGTYRLAVEASTYSQQSGTTLLSGWGQHGYGIKVCSPALTTYTTGAAVGCAPGGNIAAWNDMDINFAFPSANANNTLPLVEVPNTYAGRSVTISLFDLCDSVASNNCYAEIIPPTTASDTGTPNPTITVNYPTGVRTGTNPCDNNLAIYGANNGDNIYNGLWLNTTIQLPPNYQGGVWTLNVCTSQGTAQDTVGMKFTLLGSAVYLVPPQ